MTSPHAAQTAAPPTPAPAPEVHRPEAPSRPAVSPWRSLGVPLGAFAASRLLVFAAAGLAGWVPPGRPLLQVLTVWDGGFYVMVARDGYGSGPAATADGVGASTHAFFPVFPLLVRGVHALGPASWSWEWTTVAVAVAFGAIATVLVWRLGTALGGPDVGDRSALLFAFFPGSFVLSIAYSEPVMLTFAVACLLALVRRRWLLAGLAAAVATATRPNALVLVASCAWAAAEAVHHRREWRALVAPLLAPVGILGFFAFLWVRTGDPDVWFDVQRQGWGEQIDLGRRAVEVVGEFFAAPLANVGLTITFVTLAASVAGVVLLALARQPVALKLYGLGVIALTVASRTLIARPRFLFTAVPVLVALAQRVRGAPFMVLVGLCAAALPLVLIAYAFPGPITGAP